MAWGLVFSGGIAAGIANIGVLQVLEREGLKPDYIAGSSMGAIVGALAALGYPAEVFDGILKKLNPLAIAELSENTMKEGLHGGLFRQKLHAFLGELVGDKVIDDCPIPFLCVAGRVVQPIPWESIATPGFTADVLASVEPYFFRHDTKLIDALMATSAVPVLFSPVKIGDDSFVDLCSFGAVPARTLKEVYMPDVIVATDTQPRYTTLSNLLPKGWKEFLRAGEASLDESLAACDLVIKPDLPFGPLRFDKADAFVKAGRDAAEKALPALRALVR